MNTEEGSQDKARFELIVDRTSTSLRKISQRKKKSSAPFLLYVGFAADLGFVVALPIVGGALLGRFFDSLWQTDGKATLNGIFIGIAISLIGFVHTVMDIMKRK